MWTTNAMPRGNFQKVAMITGDVQIIKKDEDVNPYSYFLLMYEMLL